MPDMSTFNPADPASWTKLGEWYKSVRGYTPSNAELMQWMSMMMMGGGGGAQGRGMTGVQGQQGGS